jgi:putative DNA-invertase from lambdoid prophage Rac
VTVIARYSGGINLTKIKVAAYYRVSTNQQELENQRTQIHKYCKGQGLELIKEYQDVESGATPGRNGLSDCLRGAFLRQYDILVVVEMSRLTRRGIGPLFEILQQLKNAGVMWVSLREPYLSLEGPSQDLLISILAWANKLERDLISQRTKAAIQRRINLGLPVGRPKGSKDRKPRSRTCRNKPAWEKKAPPSAENSYLPLLKRNLN